jgi:hypothetical protein
MNVDLVIREAAARYQAGILPWPSSYVVISEEMTEGQERLADIAVSLCRCHGLRGLPFFVDFGDEVAYRLLCELIEESGR